MRQSLLTYAGTEQAEADFTRIRIEHGLQRALGFLNLRTWHRYTGVYEFHGPTLRCHALFDRGDLAVHRAPDELIRITYCDFVARYSTAFATSDSLTDARLDRHPARSQVRAFHAVPLLDQAERCFGAVAHWDVTPQILQSGEKQLLLTIAPQIASVVAEMRRTQEFVVRCMTRATHAVRRIEFR